MENEVLFIDDEFFDDINKNSIRKKERLLRCCSFRVEKYIRAHVRNLDDVRNLRQEVMLKVVESLKGLKGTYREEGRFIQWVLTIAVNVVNDYYRKGSRKPLLISYDSELIVLCDLSEPKSTEDFLENERKYHMLDIVYKRLSLKERYIIHSVFYLNLSFRQIAEASGMSKSACFKMNQRIIKKMREQMEDLSRSSEMEAE